MKKFIIVMLILPINYMLLFSQNNITHNSNISESKNVENEDDLIQLHILLKNDFKEDIISLQRKSKNLDDSTRINLYESYKDKPILPIVLNALLPFGIGSYVQGDNTSGYIQTFGSTLTLTLLTITVAKAVAAGITVIVLAPFHYNESDEKKELNKEINAYYTAYLISFLANLTYGIVSPICFSSNHNDLLRKALLIDDNLSLQVVPMVKYNHLGQIYPSVGVQLKF